MKTSEDCTKHARVKCWWLVGDIGEKKEPEVFQVIKLACMIGKVRIEIFGISRSELLVRAALKRGRGSGIGSGQGDRVRT